MRLALINGSPRGNRGNSQFIIDAIVEGLGKDVEYEICTLAGKKGDPLSLFRRCDTGVVVFPLYVDSMPAVVKEFMEGLDPDNRGKSLGFIVHSGFPEATQSEPLERYLGKLSRRLGCRYMGTLIKGGTEILKIPPLQEKAIPRLICRIGALTNLGGVGFLMNGKKLRNQFRRVGMTLSETGEFDGPIAERFHRFRRMSPFGFFLYKRIGEQFYWKNRMKAYGVLGESYARPSLAPAGETPEP